MKNLNIACIVSLLFMTAACDTGKTLPNNCSFDEGAMLTNYADDIIIPRFGDLETAIIDLESSVDVFLDNPTIALLSETQSSFKVAYKQYQRCSSFRFGPGLIEGYSFTDSFNTFPTETDFIETSVIAGTTISSYPNSAVGFPALDYLLFGLFSETPQDVVDKFSISASAMNRGICLSELVDELKNTTQSILTDWNSYRSTFINNTGTADGTSISEIGNEFNRDYEVMKNFKFKVPLGKFNGGVALPEKVEGYYSGISAELSSNQLAAIKDFYKGIAESGADGTGLFDYLECLQTQSGNQYLSEAIFDRFEITANQLNQVPDPMSEALINNKPVVDDAYTEMQMTVPLIKHEMTSAFGVQINYESGDGD